MKKLKGT